MRLLGSISAVAAPFAVAAVGSYLMPWFLWPDISIKVPTWQAANIAGPEASARLWVATTFLVLIVAAIGAMIAVAALMLRHFERPALGIGIATAVALAAMLGVGVFGAFDLVEHLGGVFEATVGRYPTPESGLAFLRRMILVGNIAGITAAAFIAVAVAALVPPVLPDIAGNTPEEVRKSIDAVASELASKVRAMKYLIIAAAMVLLAAVVHMKAWRDWPLAFFSEKDPAYKSYEALAGATVTYDAFYFVLILAAMFLPMSWWLRNTGSQLAALDPAVGGDPAAQQRWLTANGITLTFGEQAQRFITIVSPFLGLPALELLKKVTSIATGG